MLVVVVAKWFMTEMVDGLELVGLESNLQKKHVLNTASGKKCLFNIAHVKLYLRGNNHDYTNRY